MAVDDPGSTRSRIARRLLEPFFGSVEAADIVRDLTELSSERSGLSGPVYFWCELAKYPARASLERFRERARSDSNHGEAGMDGLWRDLRYGIRSLARSPGFSLTTVTILSVSMAATVALHSVVQQVLLDPLPLGEPDRLVSVWMTDRGGEPQRVTPGNARDLAGLDAVFRSVAAFQIRTATLARADGGEPAFLRGGGVTPGYFETLGVQPILGRAFRPDDAEPDAPPVAVLNERLWQRSFGGEASVVGRNLEMNGISVQVVGIVPDAIYPTSASVSGEIPFTSANQDYFMPLRFAPAFRDQRRSHILGVVARLHDGVDIVAAQAALTTLGARVQNEFPNNRDESFLARPFVDEVVGDVRFALWMILATGALVLLIAAVNVGSLFVLRADDRRAELGIRATLGAPAARVARQLVLESATIAAVSTVASVGLAGLVLDVMKGLVPYQVPRLAEATLHPASILAAAVFALALTVGLGLAPAWRSLKRTASPTTRVTLDPRRKRLQVAVVGLQAALGVIVLVGATLLTRSFTALNAVDPGYDADETWVIRLQAAGAPLDEVVARVREVPGVRAAALAYDHPLDRSWVDSYRIDGAELTSPDSAFAASLRPYGVGYFDAAGIEVVEGRVPDVAELQSGRRQVVVNEAFRDRHFASRSPVGATLSVPSAERMGYGPGTYEVVAVVRNVRFLGFDTPPDPAFYLPLEQFAVTPYTMLVRPARAGLELLTEVRRTINQAAPTVALQSIRPLEDIRRDLVARPRFNMVLLSSLAVMALFLCALGAYGIVGQTVVSRVREIGIRMALGADRGWLVRTVMGAALRPLALGSVVGIAVALGLSRLTRSLLFEISPADPVSFVLSPLTILLVGALAALLPTLRALAVDPAETLRP